VPVLLRPFIVRWLSVCTTAAMLATAVVPPASAAPPAPAEHEELIAEGDRLVAEGKAAEGAHKLTAAYRTMPVELRVADVGKQSVALASNAYETAWQATADAGQLEANQALLTAYFADLEAARAAGQPTSPADEQEQALRDRSTGIEQKLAELRAAAAAPAEPPPEPVPAPATLTPESVEPQLELTFPPPDPRLRRRALAMVGAGAAGTAVGGIMVIIGAVAASRAEDVRTSTPAEEAGDARSTKVAGTILAATGAIVFSGSVMLLGVGTNRLSVLREEMELTLSPTLTGMVLRGRF
jgi:hypothetical protein